MYLTLNAVESELLAQNKLITFAVPIGTQLYEAGSTLLIMEPFKKIVCRIFQRDTNVPEDTVDGVMYKSDGRIILDCGVKPVNNERYYSEIEESEVWSPARSLPGYAIRRSVTLHDTQKKHLSEFSEYDIAELGLSYHSDQMVVDGFLPILNHELLYQWWKKRYPSSLKTDKDPLAFILRF